MASVIYFGNRAKQAWIPAPKSGMEWSFVNRSNILQLDNGGVFIDDSPSGHREGSPEWEGSPDDLRIIREFRDGVWGPGPFFWCNPFTSDINALKANWATPGIILDGDWPNLTVATPTAATAAASPLGVPSRAAVFAPTNLSSGATAATITLAGMRAALVKEGVSLPAGTPFASGEGVGGLRFAGTMRETLLATGADRRFRRSAMSVKLIENGDWQ